MYSYIADDSTQTFGNLNHDEGKEQQWLKQIPLETSLEAKHILDTHVTKKTRRKEYLEYLVKWKYCSMEDSTWIDEAVLKKVVHSVEDLMSMSS